MALAGLTPVVWGEGLQFARIVEKTNYLFQAVSCSINLKNHIFYHHEKELASFLFNWRTIQHCVKLAIIFFNLEMFQ